MIRRAFAGLNVVVENPAGSTREWHDRAGRESGSTVMQHDYGFLDGHVGADGDEVDCYLGPDEAAPFAYVIHQQRAPDFKTFDEDKVMLGFASEADAKAAYLAHRNDGERAYGGMTAIPIERFKAKLQRRTGDGKIRHERGGAMVLMRIEQRGSEWVVLPEKGDKVLGKHKTKADAEKQLAAIEVAKARAHEASFFERWCRRFSCGTFEGERGADGKVRVGVWDRICVPGHDEKDGQSTDFDRYTLSEMTDNFEARGDVVPLDYNHQSNYSHQNGQPAPALAYYGALAVVFSGEIIKLGCARGVAVSGTEDGLDLSREGLWGYRCEVTELGDQLLPNFKYVSPTFMSNGTTRDGTEIGYCLAAVAATNTPWQGETQITFASAGNKPASIAGTSPATQEGARGMAKLAKLAKFAGVGDDSDDKAIRAGLAKKMEADQKAAFEDEAFDYDASADAFEEMAKAYEDSQYEEEADAEPPHQTMRKMASKFRRMAKMAGGNSQGPRPELTPPDAASAPPSGADEPAPSEGKKTGDGNAMAVMQASLAATAAKLAKLEAAEAAREKAAKKEREQLFSQLADQAIAGGYPKEERAALIEFARTNYASARAAVSHFLPKSGAPGHLFDRVSRQGAPIDGPTSAREEGTAPKRRVVKNAFARWVEVDSGLADEIKRVAESTDPVTKAKVDKLLHSSRHSVMFDRLQAAGKIVRAERPDLAEAAEAE